MNKKKNASYYLTGIFQLLVFGGFPIFLAMLTAKMLFPLLPDFNQSTGKLIAAFGMLIQLVSFVWIYRNSKKEKKYSIFGFYSIWVLPVFFGMMLANLGLLITKGKLLF